MKIIIADRQSGKTTLAIKRAHEIDAYIVCSTHKEAIRILKESKKMNIYIRFPITYNEFIHGNFFGKGCKAFIIDNVDMLLSMMARDVKIDMITMSKEED